MRLTLIRQFDDKTSTTGHLYVNSGLFCVTLEDTFRHDKKAGVTRIPAGTYEIILRHDSPMANRYKDTHGTDGMLWLQNVPEFTYVYIHIGNYAENTEGCILVGDSIVQKISGGKISQKILNSTATYKSLWWKLKNTLEIEPVYLTIIDN